MMFATIARRKSKRQLLVVAILLFAGLLWGAALLRQTQQARVADENRRQLRELVTQMGLEPLPAPPRQDAALVALGEALFFEKALSGNRDLSCATCHHPELALGDALPLSIGPGGSGLGPSRQVDPARPRAPRNAISLFNSGADDRQSYFWDGRVQALPGGGFSTPAGEYLPPGLDSALAAQAMFPVVMRHEMRGGWYDVAGYSVAPGTSPDDPQYDEARGGWRDVDVLGNPNELAPFGNDARDMPAIWQALMARLLADAGYRRLFTSAYPGLSPDALGFQHAANALAAYQRATFAVVDTPWDRYLAGDDGALTDGAVAGALLFYGGAGCSACHSGPLLSDHDYHNIGAPQFGPGTDEDAPLDYGRWQITGHEADRFAFRTPPLRNVAHSGPWLHNGAYDTLEAVIKQHLAPQAALRAYSGTHLPQALRATLQNEPVTLEAILLTLDPQVSKPRELSRAQLGQLVAFLQALGEGADDG